MLPVRLEVDEVVENVDRRGGERKRQERSRGLDGRPNRNSCEVSNGTKTSAFFAY
jgi:hypothetical protein